MVRLAAQANVWRVAKIAKVYEKPVLGYVLVGGNPDSEMYVRMKLKACKNIGIEYEGHTLE